MTLDLETLKEAIAGTSVAFRCITDYQPVGGPGDKVFPPTYQGGEYATEKRINPKTGEVRECVLLDSVQSQANRMELALLKAHRDNLVKLPLLVVKFDQSQLSRKFDVSSLEAPHRIADALFRDSLINGTIFRKSDKGKILDRADVRNATDIFGLCPTSLIFGLWDSTGPRGGLGVKFQRAIVSEIIGYDSVAGKKTTSRIDPAQIRKDSGPLYERKSTKNDVPDWTLDKEDAVIEKSKPKLHKKDGDPSSVVHGNIPPIISDGGFTISKARQTTTLSLSVLRRLCFPLNDNNSYDAANVAARTVLASLGLVAGTLVRVDTDLRSRCQLFAERESVWELLDKPGIKPEEFEVSNSNAVELLNAAVAEAKNIGLPWEEEIELTPSPGLIELVRRSQELSFSDGEKG